MLSLKVGDKFGASTTCVPDRIKLSDTWMI